MADLDTPQVRIFAHRAPDGSPLEELACLLPPPGVGGHSPPLIVWPYLGGSYPAVPRIADIRGATTNEMPSLLAAHGYAVLLPSLPLPAADRDPIERLGRPCPGRSSMRRPETLPSAASSSPERLGLLQDIATEGTTR